MCPPRDYPWLSLSFEAMFLVDILLELAEPGYAAISTRPRTDSSLLFPVKTEDREKFEALARTLRVVMKKHSHSKAFHDDLFDSKLEFLKYELFGFIQGRYKDEELEPMIEQMLAISRGEPLPDYEPLLHFMSGLQMSALAKHEHSRGGCF